MTKQIAAKTKMMKSPRLFSQTYKRMMRSRAVANLNKMKTRAMKMGQMIKNHRIFHDLGASGAIQMNKAIVEFCASVLLTSTSTLK